MKVNGQQGENILHVETETGWLVHIHETESGGLKIMADKKDLVVLPRADNAIEIRRGK